MLRRGRPILRTAAVVGTASVVSGRVQRHQQQKYDAQDQAAYDQQQQQAAPPPAPAADDVTTQLEKLAQLHTQGILTDEEFSAKKAQLLGI